MRPLGDQDLQRGERLRPGPGERPGAGRLRDPGDRAPGQRQLHGVTLLDRRPQASQAGAATQVTAVIPFFSYAKGGQDGRASRLDPGQGLRRCIGGGRGRPGSDDGPWLRTPRSRDSFKRPVDHLWAMPVLASTTSARSRSATSWWPRPTLASASRPSGSSPRLMRRSVRDRLQGRASGDHNERAAVLDIIGKLSKGRTS